jgi:hypothetical protein
LRFTTLGNSIIVDSFLVTNAKAKDKVTGGWSNALLAHQEKESAQEIGADKEGAADDEWDDE